MALGEEPETMDRPFVLVVEDEAAVRDPLAKFLALHGFDVQTAETADAALQIVAERCPAAAVIDLRLPQGSGREVILAIPPPIPVIIFSAVPHESGQLEQIRPNTRLVLKPFSLTLLAETLRRMLEPPGGDKTASRARPSAVRDEE
jgi:DNA-binding response OmpR family regulator